MKPLLILSMLITACNSSQKPEVKWVPYNTTDTITSVDSLFGDTINVQKNPETDRHQFEIIAHSDSDTIIIKNKKQ